MFAATERIGAIADFQGAFLGGSGWNAVSGTFVATGAGGAGELATVLSYVVVRRETPAAGSRAIARGQSALASRTYRHGVFLADVAHRAVGTGSFVRAERHLLVRWAATRRLLPCALNHGTLLRRGDRCGVLVTVFCAHAARLANEISRVVGGDRDRRFQSLAGDFRAAAVLISAVALQHFASQRCRCSSYRR